MSLFRNLAIGTFAAVLVAQGSVALAKSCNRTVYNNSKCTWTISVSPAHSDSGNIWFAPNGCTPKCNGRNGPCTIYPSCKMGITYTSNGGVFGPGTVTLKSGGATYPRPYGGRFFDSCGSVEDNMWFPGRFLNT